MCIVRVYVSECKCKTSFSTWMAKIPLLKQKNMPVVEFSKFGWCMKRTTLLLQKKTKHWIAVECISCITIVMNIVRIWVVYFNGVYTNWKHITNKQTQWKYHCIQRFCVSIIYGHRCVFPFSFLLLSLPHKKCTNYRYFNTSSLNTAFNMNEWPVS